MEINKNQLKYLHELIDLIPKLELIHNAYEKGEFNFDVEKLKRELLLQNKTLNEYNYRNKEAYKKYDIDAISDLFHKNFYAIDILLDENYLENLKSLNKKHKDSLPENVFELTFSEVNTIFTKVIRGEKFSYGHINRNILNGSLYKLMKYYKDYFKL